MLLVKWFFVVTSASFVYIQRYRDGTFRVFFFFTCCFSFRLSRKNFIYRCGSRLYANVIQSMMLQNGNKILTSHSRSTRRISYKFSFKNVF